MKQISPPDTTINNLVVINGLGGHAYFWDELGKALQGVRIVVLDLPGHNDTPPAEDYHYTALVENIVGRTVGLEPFHLVGWSVGGAVAWLLAASHPHLVRTLTLVEPAAPHQSPFRLGPTPEPIHAHTYASLEKVVDAFGSVDPTFSMADALQTYKQNPQGRWEPTYDPNILPALVEDAKAYGEEFYFELEKIMVPTLILRGERSFIRKEQIDEIAGALKNVRVRSIVKAGHFLVKERPEATAELINEFLQDVKEPR